MMPACGRRPPGRLRVATTAEIGAAIFIRIVDSRQHSWSCRISSTARRYRGKGARVAAGVIWEMFIWCLSKNWKKSRRYVLESRLQPPNSKEQRSTALRANRRLGPGKYVQFDSFDIHFQQTNLVHAGGRAVIAQAKDIHFFFLECPAVAIA